MTTPPQWPPGTWPRPHELADWLGKATRAEVIEFCERAIDNADVAAQCVGANHEAVIGRLQAVQDRAAESAYMAKRWKR